MSFDHNILISHELQLVEKETPSTPGFSQSFVPNFRKNKYEF